MNIHWISKVHKIASWEAVSAAQNLNMLRRRSVVSLTISFVESDSRISLSDVLVLGSFRLFEIFSQVPIYIRQLML